MQSIVKERVARFQGMHGWANRILRVDLGDMRVDVQETAPYVPEYLGARGIAARLAWEEVPEPVPVFHADNPLMIFPGALTGSPSPYSGRTSVCAFSPQASPYAWFTRSSMGGRLGGELKRAGYDGLVVTGASQQPVRLRIRDDEVSILPADELWGQDAMDALETLASTEGKGIHSMVIGPAGERLSRIATIQTASSSACGQGGFGAVMGSKRLKAISVAGTGRVTLARPETVASIARTLVRIFAEDEQGGPMDFYGDIKALNRQLAVQGDGKVVCRACTDGCITPCVAHFEEVPGAVYDRHWSGAWCCVGRTFLGPEEDALPAKKRLFDWNLSRRAAFELNVLSNRYGLNQFDLLIGMVPWLIACQKAGLISEVNGQPIDWRSASFWAQFLHAIAFREGLGDVLAEGGWAAARTLDMGLALARQRYPGWGHTAHCDAFGWSGVTFPFWLVSALQWLSDTRDPFNSGHGYLWAEAAAGQAARLGSEAERARALDRIRAIGQRVYGSPDAVDPTSGYKDKAYPGAFQTVRSVIKDCVPVDAHFPLIYREKTTDGYWRLPGIEGAGDIEGPAVEYHLFAAGTGVGWDEEEFLRAAERVCTLERALQVRHWARDRAMDEMVLPYFEQTELFQNPLLDRCYGLDRNQFRPVMDQFYALQGWDPRTGWPTRERMRDLDLGDLHEPMLKGAARHPHPSPSRLE